MIYLNRLWTRKIFIILATFWKWGSWWIIDIRSIYRVSRKMSVCQEGALNINGLFCDTLYVLIAFNSIKIPLLLLRFQMALIPLCEVKHIHSGYISPGRVGWKISFIPNYVRNLWFEIWRLLKAITSDNPHLNGYFFPSYPPKWHWIYKYKEYHY